MSATPTPHRQPRGLAIPGIDTQASIEKHATALSYGGYYTPPQSAHESRRPSLAFSSFSDAPYSGTASTGAYSQPVTPVQNISQSQDPFASQLFQNAHTHDGLAQELAHHITQAPQLAEAFAHTPFHQASDCAATNVNMVLHYDQTPQHNASDAFDLQMHADACSHHLWAASQSLPQELPSQANGLRAALFPTTSSLASHSATTSAVYNNANASFHSLDSYDTSSSAFYQHPLVVVPSQLSPADDFSIQQYSTFASPEHSNSDLSSSFDSANTSFGSYDDFGQHSPEQAYFGASEDEGYVVVKSEALTSPTPGPMLRRRYHGSGFGPSSNLPIRTRKKNQRRQRKSQVPCKGWEREDGICVQIEGKDFDVDFEEGRAVVITSEESYTQKPHHCLYHDRNGEPCGRRFERSEHLKRHMGSHTDERPYFCQLPDCKKRIQRPDNAGDHFKTHLKPGKGKRNPTCSWPELRALLREKYDAKRGNKLINNLERFIASGSLETRPNTDPRAKSGSRVSDVSSMYCEVGSTSGRTRSRL